MEVGIVNQQQQQQQEINPIENMFENNFQKLYSNIDYDCLRIYDENNQHFSMAIIFEKQEEQQEQPIGYNCIYHYKLHKIQLEFNIKNSLWKIISIEFLDEKLNSIFDDIQFFTLDQQIEILIKRLDQYFSCLEIDEIKNELTLYQPSTSLTIPEDDEQQKDIVDYGFPSFITGSRSKFSGLQPPPVAPRRSRQNSACSTQSSVRYASFIPPPIPPTAPVRRRRVIESILLHVQRKKKTFEKIVDVVRGIKSPTMNELGLEFLRVYDGRFNYREGHTFVMSFRKKTWFLTIDQINCVDCPLGDIGPRSVLILNYKGQHARVHV